jgi:hypothetical protein
MFKCVSRADCPDSENACISMVGARSPVCTCSTDALCGGGSAFCHPRDLLCEFKCADDSGCAAFDPPRSCVDRQCVDPNAHDAGPPDCAATGCSDGQMCEATGVCSIPQGCGQANTQDDCDYGLYCDGLQCQVAGSCPSIAAPPATNFHSPVIWSVSQLGFSEPVDGGCRSSSGPASYALTFVGYYYDPDGDVPQGGSREGQGVYRQIELVATDGGLGDGGAFTAGSVKITPTTFSFQLCGSADLGDGVILLDSQGNPSNTACLSIPL